jgi:hypothetical protein
MSKGYDGRAAACPEWCAMKHAERQGEDDHVHVGGALLVRRTVLRLCATVDPETGASDGPYVLVGPDEYTLHEAEALIGALTQLVDQGTGVSSRAGV